MYDPGNAKLDDAQLEAFYRSLQGYDVEKGAPLPPIVRDLLEYVTAGHILPDLGNGRADNVGDRQSDSAQWSVISKVFWDQLTCYFAHGPEYRNEVLSVIYETVLNKAKDFTFEEIHKATRYFARSASNGVNRLIEHVKPTVSIDDTNIEPISGEIGSQRIHATMPRPESDAERYLLHKSIRTSLKSKTDPLKPDRWVVLNLLMEDGDYHYADIVAALHVPWPGANGVEQLLNLKDLCAQEHSAHEYTMHIERICTRIEQGHDWSHRQHTAWSRTVNKQAPQHPLYIWDDLRRGYDLPGYLPATAADDAVCCWMPPPALTEGSLRVVYHRGLEKLRRDFAPHARLKLWLSPEAS